METLKNKFLAILAAGALSVTALASMTPFTENPTDLPQANASGSLKSTTEGGGKGAPPSWLVLLSRVQGLTHIVNPGENRDEHDQDRQDYRHDAHHRPSRGNQGFPRNQQQQNQRHLGHGL